MPGQQLNPSLDRLYLCHASQSSSVTGSLLRLFPDESLEANHLRAGDGWGRTMLIWRGWGILVVVIAFAALILMQLVVDALAGEGTYTRQSTVWGSVALLVAAP